MVSPGCVFPIVWSWIRGFMGTEKPLRYTSSLQRSVGSGVGCFHTRQVSARGGCGRGWSFCVGRIVNSQLFLHHHTPSLPHPCHKEQDVPLLWEATCSWSLWGLFRGQWSEDPSSPYWLLSVQVLSFLSSFPFFFLMEGNGVCRCGCGLCVFCAYGLCLCFVI